ncbi:Yos1-like protein [Eremomyces bilateralis CBS 781.70]|uniref:Yos1-like protein n=1 Tax=Eremomyces bilateralis CBS 781.70 TaxID=1392243 RepID=A0A6G1FT97_9PEZI|nr:Yos1-like protein [Eremomyces bilateralis CBS 781.70]KAF1808960.1 Yos1-like protein [Eremomyces bilateralis CBS 781.70]
MFFGFGNIIYICVLVTNAVTILSEDRFLARVGWSGAPIDAGFGGQADTSSVTAKMLSLMTSIRMVVRVPLIALNIFIIIYELILG